jgi:type IV pilus assembly protein PilE
MRASKGFSLVELMVVVAIVGVLAAVAVPQYSEYMLKSKLAPAFTALSTAQLRMEQFYQDNRAYGTGTTCGILPASLGVVQNFTLTCALTQSNGAACATAGQCFTYTATSTGLGGTDFKFTVDDAGIKATSQVPTGWTTNTGCWVRGKGGC